MNCTNHPDREAVGMCVYCGKPFCKECLVEVNGKMYCKGCLGKAFDEAKQSNNQQPITINNNSSSNSVSSNVNENTNNVNEGYYGRRKSKIVALLLCIFLGIIGIHRFYVGKVGTGILYLITGGLFGIGIIVDLITILTGSFKDTFGQPLN